MRATAIISASCVQFVMIAYTRFHLIALTVNLGEWLSEKADEQEILPRRSGLPGVAAGDHRTGAAARHQVAGGRTRHPLRDEPHAGARGARAIAVGRAGRCAAAAHGD